MNTLYAIRDKKTDEYVSRNFNFNSANLFDYYLDSMFPNDLYFQPPANIETIQSFLPEADLEIVKINYTIESI